MYRILSISSDEWSIADPHGKIAFRGPPRACEDWLDIQDNAQVACRRSARRVERVDAAIRRFSTSVDRRVGLCAQMFRSGYKKLSYIFAR